MTDIDKFHEWVETQSPLALREYIHAQAAWQARGELYGRKTMDDALEVLNELEQILQMNQSGDEALAIIWEYVQQKRTEFQPACGECGT